MLNAKEFCVLSESEEKARLALEATVDRLLQENGGAVGMVIKNASSRTMKVVAWGYETAGWLVQVGLCEDGFEVAVVHPGRSLPWKGPVYVAPTLQYDLRTGDVSRRSDA